MKASCPFCEKEIKNSYFFEHLVKQHKYSREEFYMNFSDHIFVQGKVYNKKKNTSRYIDYNKVGGTLSKISGAKEEYEKNPRACLNCDKLISYQTVQNQKDAKFCSQSCAGSYNNKHRILAISDEFRRKQSEINLKWRKENPEAVQKMNQSIALANSKNKRFNSKGERELLIALKQEFPEIGFTSGGSFKLKNGSGKSFDIYSRQLKLIIEYDGIHHFSDIYGTHNRVHEKDKLLNQWCIDNNWKIIRLNEATYKKYRIQILSILIKFINNIDKIKVINYLYFEDEKLNREYLNISRFKYFGE